jgi:hypothetical protein
LLDFDGVGKITGFSYLLSAIGMIREFSRNSQYIRLGLPCNSSGADQKFPGNVFAKTNYTRIPEEFPSKLKQRLFETDKK